MISSNNAKWGNNANGNTTLNIVVMAIVRSFDSNPIIKSLFFLVIRKNARKHADDKCIAIAESRSTMPPKKTALTINWDQYRFGALKF